MANPIITNSEECTLQITQGPSLHSLEHCLFAPNPDHRADGVDFEVAVPFQDAGRRSKRVVMSFVVVSFRWISMESVILGVIFKDRFRNGFWNLHSHPEIEITNYNTKGRHGYICVPRATYDEWVSKI